MALALERRLNKDQILSLYLTLAPYGGNIEGVRAASLSYFDKEPRRLTPAEAALLVALPQSPEARRPGRRPRAARAARDQVLTRLERTGVLAPGDAVAARTEPIPTRRLRFTMLAPHMAERVRREAPGTKVHRLTIDGALQARLETLVHNHAVRLGPDLSAALIVADFHSGEVLASVGSPDLFDQRRSGYLDMMRATRSPGSTLKPLIYGLAFEAGLAYPESMVEDRPTAFGDYVPQNFDKVFRGTVSVRRALQLSLNIPAVMALDAVGPAPLLTRLRRAGLTPRLPDGQVPSLAIGLGGVGLSLRDLVTRYAAIARGGKAVALSERMADVHADTAPRQVLNAQAAWQISDILAGAPAPSMATANWLAFKTGTSYGHRDAWAIGFDGKHVAGMWLGRPDGVPALGISGLEDAAPILFDAFARLGRVSLPPPPPGVLITSNAQLPPPLKRLRRPHSGLTALVVAPQIAFPPDGARVALGFGEDAVGLDRGALALKVRRRSLGWSIVAVWTPSRTSGRHVGAPTGRASHPSP
ncbi:MAG: penicillin-binding protein 1C [Paracoccaceae bacterium]